MMLRCIECKKLYSDTDEFKNNPYGFPYKCKRCLKKNNILPYIFILLITILFSISFISASDIFQTSINKAASKDKNTLSDNFLKEKYNTKYGSIEISKTDLFFFTSKTASYILSDNSERCNINCEGMGRGALYSDGSLFDDLIFIDLDSNKTVLLKNSKVQILEGYKDNYVDVPDTYKLIPSDRTIDGQTIYSEIVDKYKTINQPIEIWKDYNLGSILKSNNYTYRVLGEKSKYQNIDYILIKDKQEFREWAQWNSSIEYGLEFWANLNNTSPIANLTDIYTGQYNATMKGLTGSINSTNGISNYAKIFNDEGKYQWYEITQINGNLSKLMPANFTFAAWYNSTCGKRGTIFASYKTGITTSALMWEVYAGSGGNNKIQFLNNGVWKIGTISVPCNKWVLITVAVENGNRLLMYVNETLSYNNTLAAAIDIRGNARIGGDDNTINAATVNGMLDEIGIWNRTLSPSEIKDLSSATVFYTQPTPDTTYTLFYNNLISYSNNSEYNPDNIYQINITALNNNGSISINFNGTNYTMANDSLTNYYYNAGGKKAGLYSYYFFGNANGTLKLYNQSELYYFTIIKNNTDLKINGTSPLVYPSITDVYTYNCPNQINCSLDKNNSIFAVSNTTFIFNTSGNENYSANSTSIIINTIPNTSGCNVLFNESNPNFYPREFIVYTDCNTNYDLYKDGSSISNGSTQSLNVSIYNFTVVRQDNFNYTNISQEKDFNMSKGLPNINMAAIPSWSVSIGTSTTVTSVCPQELSCNLFLNNALVTSPDTQVLNFGTSYYKINTTGNNNYLANSFSNNLVVGLPSSNSVSICKVNKLGYDNPLLPHLNGGGCL